MAHLIYDATKDFPKEELFGITSQLRRAALSVCANLAEGYSRNGLKDRRHFYLMANSSLTETEFCIDFSYERKLIPDDIYQKILDTHTEAARVLNGLLKST